MMIIRAPRPTERFYVLDKTISENSELSWGARGILIFLLGKPDNWKVSPAHLVKQSPGGRDQVYSLLAELEEKGYIRRTPRRSAGRYAGMDYLVSDTPSPETTSQQASPPHPAFPDTEKPNPENQQLPNTDHYQEPTHNKKPPPTPSVEQEPLATAASGDPEYEEYLRLGTKDFCRRNPGVDPVAIAQGIMRRLTKQGGLSPGDRQQLARWRQEEKMDRCRRGVEAPPVMDLSELSHMDAMTESHHSVNNNAEPLPPEPPAGVPEPWAAMIRDLPDGGPRRTAVMASVSSAPEAPHEIRVIVPNLAFGWLATKYLSIWQQSMEDAGYPAIAIQLSQATSSMAGVE